MIDGKDLLLVALAMSRIRDDSKGDKDICFWNGRFYGVFGDACLLNLVLYF